MKLKPPKTAPKDGTMIIGDFGWPYFLPAMWDADSAKWVIATMQACGDDRYFENEYEDDTELKCWTPFPQLPR